MFEKLKTDLAVNSEMKSYIILILFRTGAWLYQRKSQLSPVPYIIFLIFYRILVEWLFCVELPLKAKVGKGLIIYHGYGLVVHPSCELGDYVILRSGVVLGNKGAQHIDQGPKLGHHVEVGANAVIIGDIHIGEHCIIGAGTVVNKSIAPHSVAVGTSFRVFPRKTS